MLGSMLCQRAHWDESWFARWEARFRDAAPVGGAFTPRHIRYHRKIWEWVAIAQALEERGLLAQGKRGGGFAVGREPLACLFASHGADILATDLGATTGSAQTWSEAGQHAASLDALHWPDLIDRASFDARVRFMPQDMRALNPAALGSFDFIWSSCSLEHLGTLEAGLQFVLRSTELLKPGGIAVHTTEFNLSAQHRTVSAGDNVIYRGRDIADLAHRLRGIGCAMERFDDFAGTAREDIEYDFPPYYEQGRQHIKLLLGGFVSTSCLLIITKGDYPAALPSIAALPLRADDQPPRSLASRARGLAGGLLRRVRALTGG